MRGIDAISTVATGFQMVTGSAAAAAGSTTLAISGWAATILGPSLGGLVTIYEIHKAAEFNGLCKGYWDAYQLMAKQYSHESLRNPPPLKSWPPLQKPTPGKNKNVIDLSFTRTARKGYEVGFRKAYNDVLEMESSPKVIEVHPTALERTAGAKITRIKVTGRVFLRGLWLQYGDNVADMIHAELDKNLVKSGKGKWPIQ